VGVSEKELTTKEDPKVFFWESGLLNNNKREKLTERLAFCFFSLKYTRIFVSHH